VYLKTYTFITGSPQTINTYLLALTFEKFIEELQVNFPPSDWVETMCISLLGMRMACNTWFWDCAPEVCTLNMVLHGTLFHLAETALKNQLEAGLKSALQAECANEELYKMTSVKEWIEQVQKIDEHLTSERK
jgi:hypothetical protein